MSMTSAASRISVVFLWSSVELAYGMVEETTEGKHSALPGFAEMKALLLVYVVSISLVAILTVGIYHKRGVGTCAAIMLYLMALSTMSVLIRNCYVNHDFKFPEFLTATHFLATAMVGSTILLCRYAKTGQEIKVPSKERFFKHIVPVAFAFVTSLGLANYAILFSNAHFYEMASSTTPLFTAFLAYILGHDFDLRLVLPLTIATAGMVVVGFGETVFSVPGFVCCTGAVFLRSVKATVQNMLLKGRDDVRLDPVELAVWISVVCFVVMSAWSIMSSGAEPFRHIMAPSHPFCFAAVLLTCACAAILNISALFVLQELGPVVQQIVGQLKGVISCLGAMAVFDEVITVQQKIGYVVMLVGVAWYNSRDMALKAERKEKEATFDETSRLTHSKV